MRMTYSALSAVSRPIARVNAVAVTDLVVSTLFPIVVFNYLFEVKLYCYLFTLSTPP